MSKSIADQLLGLGLADKKQVQKDKSAKRKQEKQSRKHKLSTEDDAKAAAEKARQEKSERDRQLNLERQAVANQKALLAQVKQIIETARVDITEGDIKFNFADRFDNKIKSIYVTEQIQNDLANGKLAIAQTDNRNFVVTKSVAEKIMERSDKSVLFIADQQQDQIDEDDPYKDFIIPDDLMW